MKKILSLILLSCSSFLFAAEGSMYDFSWLDKDKEVYVLQNRKFRKKGSVYFGGTLGKSLAGAFIDSSEYNLITGFFFSEDWGIELSYTDADGKENSTSESVQSQATTPFYRKIDKAVSAMIVWSPFYSKINTFNKIFYYDWMFGLGFTNTDTIDNRTAYQSNGKTGVETKESISGVTWMTALRFYISSNWSTRIDLRATHLNTVFVVGDESSNTEEDKRWFHYYNVNVGLNYTF